MKKILQFVFIVFPLFLLSACSEEKEETANNYATITDHAGREIVLEKKAEKLVTSYYITTSAVLGLGLADTLVGIENQAQLRPLYQLMAPELHSVANVGTAKDVDIEKTMSLEPDLVIIPLRVVDSAHTLEELGVKVICVNPESHTELMQMLNMIGEATGTKHVAEKINKRIDNAISELGTRLKDEAKPKVYLSNNSSLLSTAGKKMYQHALMTQAGAQNVAENIDDTYWAAISYEQLIAYNPDYIIIASAATYGVDDVLNNPHIQELDCIKNKNVYKMPSSLEAWDSPVPASYLGSLWLASIIHPEQYSEEEYAKEMQGYYKEFYGFDVDISKVK